MYLTALILQSGISNASCIIDDVSKAAYAQLELSSSLDPNTRITPIWPNRSQPICAEFHRRCPRRLVHQYILRHCALTPEACGPVHWQQHRPVRSNQGPANTRSPTR
ncbi:hypothetical protein L227DRAFT_570578 [Lentinus tigrinus ALCF2SS1-6]|uniref:Uncharacterized protein n=1 Tax=Lentinus tigrinus ALCF2SS1-6 TaxID=1328759 RepID=A0A5C2SQ52_9APHY|nr:hypothetical protein L227DRAFT_570578 [Lentinus tigrinus ALCF2SS1-6]